MVPAPMRVISVDSGVSEAILLIWKEVGESKDNQRALEEGWGCGVVARAQSILYLVLLYEHCSHAGYRGCGYVAQEDGIIA